MDNVNADGIVKAVMAKGFDEAVAQSSLGRCSYLKITNSKIDLIVEKFSESGMIFASKQKRQVFTNLQDLGERSIENGAERARELVGTVERNKDYYGIAKGPFKYARGAGCDKKIEGYTNETIADIAYSCINSALENGAKSVGGSVFIATSDAGLSTSRNVSVTERDTMLRISLRLFRGNFSAQNIIAARYLKDINPATFAKETANLLGHAGKTGKIESGKYDIVYTPSAGGTLLIQVPDMATMSSVEDGTCFTKKMGQTVADRGISIYDDGNMPGAIDASPYDNEGYPTQRTPVIRKGVLKNYLHNFSTAKKYKTKSTGNAGLVNPSPNTMCFEHEKTVKSIDDLVRKVDRGVLVTNTRLHEVRQHVHGRFLDSAKGPHDVHRERRAEIRHTAEGRGRDGGPQDKREHDTHAQEYGVRCQGHPAGDLVGI